MQFFLKGLAAALAASLFFFSNLQAQTPCENGTAGGYPCNKVDLMAHLSPADLLAEEHDGILLNDIWGWTDPQTGKEYALVGMANGTSFVDVSDPLNPLMLGILPEHHAATNARQAGIKHDGGKSVWRDIKVYQNHAFIVSEDEGHGMQVFDLTQLREVQNPPATFGETANYQGIGKAHNLVINEETGYAYAVGANSAGKQCNAGGLHIINIQEPAKPVFAGCYDADGYTHDAHCVIYNGPDAAYQGLEICFSANENAITLVDVSNKLNPQMISSESYTGVQYAHQGWLTEDHRFFISNDELDERANGTNTTSYIWDMQDLDNPVLLGTYISELTSVDHNLYIKDALAYEANYTSGLRILNILDIENARLKEIAYFDTYPSGDPATFKGAWSNYPFFESGIVVVSDIEKGLFVLKPTFTAFGEEAEEVVVCEPSPAAFEVLSNKFNVTYQWQVNEGNGFVDLENNELYSNVNSPRLQLAEGTEAMDSTFYRAVITETESGEQFVSEPAAFYYGAPEAGFTVLDEKGVVKFTNTSVRAASFIWDFGDGSAPEEAENPLHRYTSQGTFEVTLTAVNDCGSDVLIMSITPDVCPAEDFPVADFEISEENGEEVQFINQSARATSYRWDFGDGSLPVEGENPSHKYQSSGPFDVILEAMNDCGSDVFIMTISPVTGIHDKVLAKNFRIYPNPSEGLIHLDYKNAASKVTALRLFTLSGQQLFYKKINPLQDSRSHELDVSRFDKGMYVLKIKTEKGSLSRRIFVQ